MRTIPVFLLMLFTGSLFCFCSKQKSDVTNIFNRVETVIEQQPDSAFRLLHSIIFPENLSKDMFNKVLISVQRKGYTKMLPQLPEKSLPCMYRSENCYAIDPAGYVYKCIEHLGNEHYAIGNIIQKNMLVTKLAESAFEEDPFDDDECFNCNILPVCGGGCPLDRIKNKGEKEKAYCSFYKSKLADLLPYLYKLYKP